LFEDCPIKKWMGCSDDSNSNISNSEGSCRWMQSCDSPCPLTKCGIPLLLIPLLFLVFGFCPLVWFGIIGILVYHYTRNSQSESVFPVKIGLCVASLLLIPCFLKCCPLIWALVIGLSIFMIKKGVCEYSGNEGKESRLIKKLHRIALDCLDSEDKIVIQKAKDILQRIIELSPNDKIALYNLACTESLLGNVNEALETLDRAIEAGYNDYNHMVYDSDFNNIKNTEGFKNLEKKLLNILFPHQEEQIEEPVVKEEKKEDQTENKMKILHELFPLLPVDTLRDILIQCKGDTETAIETIIKIF